MLTSPNNTGNLPSIGAKSSMGFSSPFQQASRRLFDASFFTPAFYDGLIQSASARRLVAVLLNLFKPVANGQLAVIGDGSTDINKGRTMTALLIADNSVNQLDNLFCLNDLHKASGNLKNHKPAFFLRNAQTKALITELERVADSQLVIRVARGGNDQGTYVCQELVVAYANWISPAFYLKVIRAFLNQEKPQTKVIAVTIQDGNIIAQKDITDCRVIDKEQFELARASVHVIRDTLSLFDTPETGLEVRG